MASVRDFGAIGDGQADDTESIQRGVDEGDGLVFLPRGRYLIRRPIEIRLARCGRTSISGAEGCATLVMTGAGPAIHLVGTHEGTADPDSFTPEVRERQSFPVISGLEIVGTHPEADGIELDGLWQPTLSKVSIRACRHGIHVVRRNRNLIIAECHVYDNRGVGIFYDHVNLHQSNIYGSHLSYNRAGGIKVLGSEIRNLQICGNDIEYNCDRDAEESADVWIETLGSSVLEGTIVGNTIQALPSPNGANVRFRGHRDAVRTKTGHWTITGNLISSQRVNLHLQYARGVVVTGNSFFSGHDRTMRIEQSDLIVVGPNCIDRNPDYRVDSGDGIVFDRCVGCSMSGVVMNGARPSGPEPRAAVEVLKSRQVSITNCQILDCRPRGVCLEDSANCIVSGCTILAEREAERPAEPIRVSGGGGHLVQSNILDGR